MNMNYGNDVYGINYISADSVLQTIST